MYSHISHIRKLLSTLFIIALLPVVTNEMQAQRLTLHTNVAYWATTTPNVGIEGRIADRWTIGASGSYNSFHFPQWQDEDRSTYNPKLAHWTAVPEIKYWFCKAFERSSVGLHGIYGAFNIGAIPLFPEVQYYRYEGYAYGGGISYGYHWAIGKRWGFEFSLGVGYLHLRYTKIHGYTCGREIGTYSADYVGPSKLALSFHYFLK